MTIPQIIVGTTPLPYRYPGILNGISPPVQIARQPRWGNLNQSKTPVRYTVGLGLVAYAATLPAFSHAKKAKLVAPITGDPLKARKLSNTTLRLLPPQRDSFDACVVGWAPGLNFGIVLERGVDDAALVAVHRLQLERAARGADDFGELFHASYE